MSPLPPTRDEALKGLQVAARVAVAQWQRYVDDEITGAAMDLVIGALGDALKWSKTAR